MRACEAGALPTELIVRAWNSSSFGEQPAAAKREHAQKGVANRYGLAYSSRVLGARAARDPFRQEVDSREQIG
jgi:hypothetical protein